MNEKSVSRDDNPLDDDGYYNKSFDEHNKSIDHHKNQLKDFFKNLNGRDNFTGKGLDQYMKELDQYSGTAKSIPDDMMSQSSKASIMANKLKAKVNKLENKYLSERYKMPTS